MNVKVEAYVADRQREEAARKQARREKILRNAGLAQKIYSPYEQASQEFPHYDHEEMRYYKLIFEEVTEEEFALLERYAAEEKEERPEEGNMFSNIGGKIKSVATAVCWIGIIASVLTGIVMLAQGDEGILFGFITAGLGALVSWVSSLFLYGFGELIVKVTQIEKNTRK